MTQFKLACQDIAQSMREWRLWIFLGWNDILKQYRRSFIGPLWLTISTGIMVGAFGVIWASIFTIPISEYLPYVATGHIIYLFINNLVLESTTVFSNNDAIIKQVPVAKFVFTLRHVVRNVIVFLHNIVIAALVLWYFDYTPLASWTITLLGLLFITINGVFIGVNLGLLATRFRDVPMIVTNLMQVLFFITPVLWKAEQLSEATRFVVDYNPVAVFLMFTRDPLFGLEVTAYQWQFILWVTLINFLVAMISFTLFRRKIVYWL